MRKRRRFNKAKCFDNALINAKIGNVKLITVSSMSAVNTEVVELPKLNPGSMIICVSDKKGDKISAALVIAIGKVVSVVYNED
ncbi:MAG: hypothetical protein LBT10_05905 [Methanobrevibacter sp.]|nr:hypothetical protein [Methanobrevibacter sp.]